MFAGWVQRDTNLVRDGMMGNLVILIKNVKPSSGSHCCSGEERRQPYPQHVSHVFASLSLSLSPWFLPSSETLMSLKPFRHSGILINGAQHRHQNDVVFLTCLSSEYWSIFQKKGK